MFLKKIVSDLQCDLNVCLVIHFSWNIRFTQRMHFQKIPLCHYHYRKKKSSFPHVRMANRSRYINLKTHLN